jgi:hypothetical protein
MLEVSNSNKRTSLLRKKYNLVKYKSFMRHASGVLK